MSLTERSSAAMNSRMCRRRGSAMALNGSDVVEARAGRTSTRARWRTYCFAATPTLLASPCASRSRSDELRRACAWINV